jgi:hypothetical protein
MSNPSRSRAVRTLAPVSVGVALAALAACGDSRVRSLSEGISKDSAFKVLGQGAPKGDSLPNMYKHGQYLVQGKMFDVYFFDPKNRKAWTDAAVPDKELTPVIMIDRKVQGWGWGDMDEITEKYHIQARAPGQVK